jgi:hypothetical protein
VCSVGLSKGFALVGAIVSLKTPVSPQYVGHTHGICEDGDDSAEVFYKHHSFLLLQMVRGREDVHWPETSIFKRLCEKYPVG